MQTSGTRVLFTLTRFPVSAAVTFTAFAAMVISAGEVNTAMLMPLLGIFLLASGASAFNQYQEWPYDEKMERTRKRPLPSRRISTAEALRIAMICIIGGLVVLLYYATVTCMVLGIVNVIWYNGLYTWLKRKTAFAVVPGAITGAIPVMMGWTAVGGSITAPEPLFLSFFLFLWQMPHFWLLTLKYGDQYRMAGFPVLTDHLTAIQVKTVTMAWMTASAAAAVMLVFFRILQHPVFSYALIALNIVLLGVIAWQFFFARSIRYRMIFIAANLFMLLVMVALVGDRLFWIGHPETGLP